MCRVVLDYDGYVRKMPTCLSVLGDDVAVIPYSGDEKSVYWMADTVVMVKHDGETLKDLIAKAKKVSPLAYQVIVCGEEASRCGLREDTYAVCIDRNFMRRKVYVC